ncbi:hypothetical protein AB0M20_21105, partial [Actinoplanes sp. NPDC051633]
MRRRSWAGTGLGLLAAAVMLTAAAPAQAVTPGDTASFTFAARITNGDHQRASSRAHDAPQWVATASACFDGAAAGLAGAATFAGGRSAEIAGTVRHPDAG